MDLIIVGASSIGILCNIFTYWKASQHRKNALFVINTSLLFKVVVVVTAAYGIKIAIESWVMFQTNLLYSIMFIAFFLSLLLLSFSIPVIFKEDYIYLTWMRIPWELVMKISFNLFFWKIETNRRRFGLFFIKNLFFIKLIWKFSSQDIKQIKELLDKKKSKNQKNRGQVLT